MKKILLLFGLSCLVIFGVNIAKKKYIDPKRKLENAKNDKNAKMLKNKPLFDSKF